MDGLILKDSPASSTASSNGTSSEKELSVKLSAHLRIFSTRAPIFLLPRHFYTSERFLIACTKFPFLDPLWFVYRGLCIKRSDMPPFKIAELPNF